MTVDNSCNQSTTKQRTPTLWLHLRPLFIKENPTKTYQIEFDISNPSCFTDVSTSEFRHPLNASSVFRSRENLKRLLINVITMLYCSFLFTATFTVVSFPHPSLCLWKNAVLHTLPREESRFYTNALIHQNFPNFLFDKNAPRYFSWPPIAPFVMCCIQSKTILVC